MVGISESIVEFATNIVNAMVELRAEDAEDEVDATKTSSEATLSALMISAA